MLFLPTQKKNIDEFVMLICSGWFYYLCRNDAKIHDGREEEKLNTER